jgi:hypothetical protein
LLTTSPLLTPEELIFLFRYSFPRLYVEAIMEKKLNLKANEVIPENFSRRLKSHFLFKGHYGEYSLRYENKPFLLDRISDEMKGKLLNEKIEFYTTSDS